MRTVLLYGHLRKLFGKKHCFDIKSPVEAIRALGANFKDFRAQFSNGSYVILSGSEDLSLDRLEMEGAGAIKIIPVNAGAGGSNGWKNILIGAAVIAAVYFTGGAAGFFGGFAPALYGMGASMVLNGVSQLLSKPPNLQNMADRSDNQPSLAFDGPVNMYAQGQPVPIGYGTLLIGSSVISASIVANSAPTADTPMKPCGGGIPTATLLNTPTGSATAGSLVAGSDIYWYDALNCDFTPQSTTVEYNGNVKGATVTLKFIDVAPTVKLAWDTDLYRYNTFTTVQAKNVEVGDQLAKAGGGYLTVETKTDGAQETLKKGYG